MTQSERVGNSSPQLGWHSARHSWLKKMPRQTNRFRHATWLGHLAPSLSSTAKTLAGQIERSGHNRRTSKLGVLLHLH